MNFQAVFTSFTRATNLSKFNVFSFLLQIKIFQFKQSNVSEKKQYERLKAVLIEFIQLAI